MRKLGAMTATGMLLLALAGTAGAQAPAPGEGLGSSPSRGPGRLPAAGTALGSARHARAGTMGPGGMMSGDMGRMMQQMMQGRMAASAIQPFRRIEGQLAYFRAELRMTDAQAQSWNAFADSVRAQAERLRQATQQAMTGATEPAPRRSRWNAASHCFRRIWTRCARSLPPRRRSTRRCPKSSGGSPTTS